MKATKYIVIGKYDCERNSYVPGGDIRHVISGHRDESAAWKSANRSHSDLGGCDGSDMLTKVMQRFAPLSSRQAADFSERGGMDDSYEHAGWLYVECDLWRAHQIVSGNGALNLVVR